MHCFSQTDFGKGSIDVLGGLVKKLYLKIVEDLEEEASNFTKVVLELNHFTH